VSGAAATTGGAAQAIRHPVVARERQLSQSAEINDLRRLVRLGFRGSFR